MGDDRRAAAAWSRTKAVRVGLGALAVGLVLSGAGVAAADEAMVAYRQQLMQAIGGNTAAVATIVKNRLPMTDAVAEHADQLESGAELIEAAFKDEVLEGPNDALPEIWTQWEAFLAIAEEMEQASEALAEAAEADDPRAVALAMRELGRTCGSCHKAYRKPSQDSYRQE